MQDRMAGTPVVDKRPVPRGVVPRRVQAWIMAALAAGILGIIVLTGRPDAPRPETRDLNTTVQPRADRLREYQDRLRLLDERARQELAAGVLAAARPTGDRTQWADEREHLAR